jgi:P-type E1-E2 ATPase
MIAERVAVVRDGVVVEIAASGLVPGDLVRLEAGMKVPADLRLIAADDLQIAEAALTGESVPVEKAVAAVAAEALLADRTSIAHAGTVVARGTGLGLVVETAARTAIGQLAGALATLKPTPAPLVVMLERLTERIAIGAIALLPVVAAALYLNGEPLVSLFFLCVALAISAIPEGLPIAITIVLAIAAQRMAERNVIAKGLPTVEGLGSCTMLVTDKTGTITLNQLTVVALWLPAAGEVPLDQPNALAALGPVRAMAGCASPPSPMIRPGASRPSPCRIWW